MIPQFDTEKEWLLAELGWCGCWEPCALITLRDYLRLRNVELSIAKRDASFQENNERWLLAKDKHVAGLAYLLEGTCDRLGLTEHGTSCRYSWLTEKGKSVLVMLDAVEDFEDWAEQYTEEAK